MDNQNDYGPGAATGGAIADLGPLAWVVDTLQETLNLANGQLQRFSEEVAAAKGSHVTTIDTAALRLAAQGLHDAVGVLDMVDRPTAALVVGAMEALTRRLIDKPELCTPEATALVDQASRSLVDYLQNVLRGQPDLAPGLFPAYRPVAELAALSRVHPADLWPHPDHWEWQTLASPPDVGAGGEVGQSAFFDVLLRTLRSQGQDGASDLSTLGLRLAAASTQPAARAFWELFAGCTEVLAMGGVQLDDYLKRALSGAATQLAALQHGTTQVPARQGQDLLYFTALGVHRLPAEVPVAVARAVVTGYGVQQVPVAGYGKLLYGAVRPESLKQVRQQLLTFQDLWSEVAAGDMRKLDRLGDTLSQAVQQWHQFWPEESALSTVLQEVTGKVQASGTAPLPAVGLEVATAMLYLESLLDDAHWDDAVLSQRTTQLARRITQAAAGEDPGAPDAWMQALYMRQSDRDTMQHVMKESRALLGEIEQALDTFFRDPAHPDTAQAVPARLSTMSSLLAMLGFDEASTAAQAMGGQATRLLQAAAQPGAWAQADTQHTLTLLGTNLGNLSFLLDMMGYQPEQVRQQFRFHADSEEFLQLQSAEGAAVAEAAQAPAVEVPQPAAEVSAAPVPVAQVAVPAAAPVDDGIVDDFIDDAELRDIFMEEAVEVVGNGQAALAALQADPSNAAQLTTLRRAFHTLKGSGRMVGLASFGEAAWAMERVLNAWLAENQPASADLLALSRDGLQALSEWRDAIAAGHAPAWTHQDVARSAAAFQDGKGYVQLQPSRAAGAGTVSVEPAEATPAAPAPAAPAPAPQPEVHAFPLLVEGRAPSTTPDRYAGPSTEFLTEDKPKPAEVQPDFLLTDLFAAPTAAPTAAAPVPAASVPPAVSTPVVAPVVPPSQRADDDLAALTPAERGARRNLLTPATEPAATGEVLFPARQVQDEGLHIDISLEGMQGDARADESGLASVMTPEEAAVAHREALHAPLTEGHELPEALFPERITAVDLAIDGSEATPAAVPAALDVPSTQGMELQAPPTPPIDWVLEEESASPAAGVAPLTPAEPLSAPAVDLELHLEGLQGDAHAEDSGLPADVSSSSASVLDREALEVPPTEGHILDASLTGDAIVDIDLSLEGDESVPAPSVEVPAPVETPVAEVEAPVEPEAAAAPEPAPVPVVPVAAATVPFAPSEAVVEALTGLSAQAQLLPVPHVSAEPAEAASTADHEEAATVSSPAAVPQAGPTPLPDAGIDALRTAHPELAGVLIDTRPQQTVLAEMVDGLPDDEIRQVGALRLPLALCNAFIEEAESWSSQLDSEVQVWAQLPQGSAPESAAHLAHSLAGSAGAVGLSALASVARATEHALDHLHLRRAVPGEAEVILGAADTLRQMLHQFAAGCASSMPVELLQALVAIVDQPLIDESQAPIESVVAQPEAPEWAVTEEATASGEPDVVPAESGSVDNVPVVSNEAVEAGAQDAASAAAPQPELQPESKIQPEVSAVSAETAAPVEVPPPAAAAPVDRQPVLAQPSAADEVVDAIDPELFAIFQDEADEMLPRLGDTLRQWSAHPEQEATRAGLMRLLHTLKGSARLAGAMRLGALAHEMETAVGDIAGGVPDAAQIDMLAGMVDRMDDVYHALSDGAQAEGAAEAVAAVEAAPIPAEAPVPAAEPAGVAAEPVSPNENEATAPEQGGAAAQPQVPAVVDPAVLQHIAQPVATNLAAHQTAQQQQVRVRARLLDRMLGQAGEVMTSRARLEGEVDQLRTALGDMDASLERLRKQLRDMELQAESQMQSRMAQSKDTHLDFDPLEFDRFTRVQELTRMMAESVNDVASVQRNLQRTVQATEDDLSAQARQTKELQRDLLRTRMVEFDSLSDRLYRVVRQSALESDKRVRLDISGAGIEMDRSVIERIAPVFEHLLRNAVVHGIEAAGQREQSGKEAVGQIAIALQQEGNDVIIHLRDDGAGLNVARIREKAIEKGLLTQDAPFDDNEAAQLIFQSGLSTAVKTTSLAGRGVGMDVVRTEVNALGGHVDVASHAGQGTEFRLVLPLTTAVTQVVQMRMGDGRFGVPSSLIESVRRATPREVEQAYNSRHFAVDGTDLPFYWGGAMVQASPRSQELASGRQIVVVLRSAAQRIVMHVDEVLGTHEVVVKNIGAQLARMPGLTGITLLADGRILYIYNPVALSFVYGEQIRAFSSDLADPGVLGGERSGAAPLRPEVQVAPLVLVVDDSITVRRVTERLLRREGYRVSMASDGLAALRVLAEERPALVLSDIEMPQMDGFDLLRNIRGDEQLHDLPVVMITSRTADKHREHAEALGASGFLGKPYSEERLLELIRTYAGAGVHT